MPQHSSYQQQKVTPFTIQHILETSLSKQKDVICTIYDNSGFIPSTGKYHHTLDNYQNSDVSD